MCRLVWRKKQLFSPRIVFLSWISRWSMTLGLSAHFLSPCSLAIPSSSHQFKCYQGPLFAKYLLWASPLSRTPLRFPFTSQLLKISTHRSLPWWQLPREPRCWLWSLILFSIHIQASPHHAPESLIAKFSHVDLKNYREVAVKSPGSGVSGPECESLLSYPIHLSVPQFSYLSSDNINT